MRGDPELNFYRLEIISEPCSKCGEGKMWAVVGPDDIAIGIDFADECEAYETAVMLERAYELGRAVPGAKT